MTTSTSTPVPTGRREDREGRSYVVLTRSFRAPVADVWAAVTEPERLARWIGTWSGDPATGQVEFRMLFEGEQPPETFTIDASEPPHRLRITTSMTTEEGEESWRLELDLAESDGTTTLTFAQDVPDPAMADGVGPGWEYYLDRMVAAETGGDPGTVVFDDYYPGLRPHYRAAFGLPDLSDLPDEADAADAAEHDS